MAHSEFSPSQLKRIIECPGSVALYRSAEWAPAPESQYAAEGTLLHSYMEDLMMDNITLGDIEDAEHRTVCEEAMTYVKSVMAKVPNYRLYSELRVELKREPAVYGTTDVVIYSPDTKELHILDYKFGRHVFVSVQDNPQFLAYALGTIDTLNIQTDGLTIHMHVVQPRKDNMCEEAISYYELNKWYETSLRLAIAQANSDNPHFNPTESTCMWCSAKAICPARSEQVKRDAQSVFQAYADMQQGLSLSMEQVKEFYDAADNIEKQIKAVRDYILAELMRGTKIDGLKVVRARANRKFKDETIAARFLEKHYDADIDALYETKMRSPAQIEGVYKALKKDPEYQKLIMTGVGKPSVVNADDKRPAIQDESPFSGYSDEEN